MTDEVLVQSDDVLRVPEKQQAHVTVDGLLSVNEGHRIGHEVKDRLCAAEMHITDVLVHIEPEQLYESRQT